MFRKQMLGLAGALVALGIVGLAWLVSPWITARLSLPDDNPAGRLAFAAQWLVVPGLSLLAGVFGAARRGFFADAIDGTRTPASHDLEINLRYNQNTVEQTLLVTIAWPALAVALPYDRLGVIGVAAVLFAIGRVAFWVGYLVHPMARAFGMTLTVLPTLAAYAWLIWRSAT